MSSFARVLFAALVLGASLASMPARAQTDEAAAKACHAGGKIRSVTAASKVGNMPLTLDGVTTVSPQEAHCLIGKLGSRLAVIQAMEDEHRLPGAVEIPELGYSSLTDSQVAYANAKADKAVGRDHSRPVLVYCHHSSCPLSVSAARRLHERNFTTIYWMRDGIEGWQAAGYSFAQDPGRLSARYEESVANCENGLHTPAAAYVVGIEGGGDVERYFASALQSDQTHRAACLRQAREQFTDNPAALADIDRRLARSDADLGKAYAEARAKVEADPASYLLQDIDLEKLRKTLANARSVQTFEQACGDWDTSVPSSRADKSELDDARQRYSTYARCYNNFIRGTNEDLATGAYAFRETAKAVVATERYTCSRRGGAHCVPDASWRRIADVAGPANAALVDKAWDLLGERQDATRKASDELDNFLARLNAAIDAHNSYQNEENSRASSSYSGGYTAPAYPAPPPPPVYRPMPSAIYPGMK